VRASVTHPAEVFSQRPREAKQPNPTRPSCSASQGGRGISSLLGYCMTTQGPTDGAGGADPTKRA
jgi:hypothetical protein